jgi:hypothetical protein
LLWNFWIMVVSMSGTPSMAPASTTFQPPEAMRMGTKVAVHVGGRWREGTCIELRDEMFRVRYHEELPNGVWSMWHGKPHDAHPVPIRLVEHAVRLAKAVDAHKIELRGGGVVIMPCALDAGQQAELLHDCLQTMLPQKVTGTTLGDKPPPDMVWSYEGSAGPSCARPACLDHAAGLLERLGHHRRQMFEADSRESDPSLHLIPLLCNLAFERVCVCHTRPRLTSQRCLQSDTRQRDSCGRPCAHTQVGEAVFGTYRLGLAP